MPFVGESLCASTSHESPACPDFVGSRITFVLLRAHPTMPQAVSAPLGMPCAYRYYLKWVTRQDFPVFILTKFL